MIRYKNLAKTPLFVRFLGVEDKVESGKVFSIPSVLAKQHQKRIKALVQDGIIKFTNEDETPQDPVNKSSKKPEEAPPEKQKNTKEDSQTNEKREDLKKEAQENEKKKEESHNENKKGKQSKK